MTVQLPYNFIVKITKSLSRNQKIPFSVLTKYQFTSDRIYNLHKTGVTTVMYTPKLVSAERGELVTECARLSAAGYIPPTFVFPRIHH